jgi:hypothetical protein
MPPMLGPRYPFDKIRRKRFNAVEGELFETLACETMYALSRI